MNFDIAQLLSIIHLATEDEKSEIDRLLEGVAYYHRDHPPSFLDFLRLYVWTDEGGKTKFDPWPWQAELAEFLPYRENCGQTIILKARQIGMTWFMSALAL